MFTINSHPQVHPEPVHPSTREAGTNEGGGASKTAPVSVTSPETAGFASTPRTTGVAATFVSPDHPVRVTLPGDSTAYYVKDTSKAGVPQALYTRDPQTGMLKQTSKQALSDGNGGWKAVDGLKGGLNYSPEARAARLQEAQNHHEQAAGRLGRAQTEVDKAEKKYEAARNIVYQAKLQVERTDELIRVVGQRIEYWQKQKTNSQNDFDGAQRQLSSITDSHNASPDRLTHAQSQLAEASRNIRAAENRLTDANNTMALLQSQRETGRRNLEAGETARSTAAGELTSSQNELRAARTDAREATDELRNAQSA